MDTKELERSLSMDEILKTIRSVVTEGMEKEEAEDESVLELTEVVEAGNPIVQSNEKPKDVLAAIDDVIGEKGKEIAKKPASDVLQQATTVSNLLNEIKAVENTTSSASKVDEAAFFEPVKEPEAKLNNPVNLEPEIAEIDSNKEGLISNEAIEASAKALKSLIKEEHKIVDKEDLGEKLTLEELVIRLLKPELSKWLDKNLPNIIQKIVEKEIKKIMPKAKK